MKVWQTKALYAHSKISSRRSTSFSPPPIRCQRIGRRAARSLYAPQALRVVIPALVGMVIAGFMDTSLLVIVGVLDLVGITNNVVSQTEFLGLRREVLVFITFIYFIISFTFANISRRIEATGAGKAMARKI